MSKRYRSVFQHRRSLQPKGLRPSTAQTFGTLDRWGRVQMLQHFVPYRHRCCLLEVEVVVVAVVVVDEEEEMVVKNSY